jgi:hypothetical protein
MHCTPYALHYSIPAVDLFRQILATTSAKLPDGLSIKLHVTTPSLARKISSFVKSLVNLHAAGIKVPGLLITHERAILQILLPRPGNTPLASSYGYKRDNHCVNAETPMLDGRTSKLFLALVESWEASNCFPDGVPETFIVNVYDSEIRFGNTNKKTKSRITYHTDNTVFPDGVHSFTIMDDSALPPIDIDFRNPLKKGGEVHHVPLPHCSMMSMTGFSRNVLQHAVGVPTGRTRISITARNAPTAATLRRSRRNKNCMHDVRQLQAYEALPEKAMCMENQLLLGRPPLFSAALACALSTALPDNVKVLYTMHYTL